MAIFADLAIRSPRIYFALQVVAATIVLAVFFSVTAVVVDIAVERISNMCFMFVAVVDVVVGVL